MTQIQISSYVINELLSNIKEKSQKSDWVPKLCAWEKWAHFGYLYRLYLICLLLRTKYIAMQNFDRSEIIIICWIGAQVTFLIIINIKKLFFDKWKVQKNSIYLKSKSYVTLWMPLQPL